MAGPRAQALSLFDRGILDSMIDGRAPDWMEAAARTHRYSRTVFVPPPWREIYTQDDERKHTEIMGNINQQRTVLEGRLEQLRTFEREYRTRLKTYLESQLEELGQRGSAAPADSAAGGEGAGFGQFNRGNS